MVAFGAVWVFFIKTQIGHSSYELQRRQQQFLLNEATKSRILTLEEMSLDDFMQEVNEETINIKHAQAENDYGM